MLFHKLLVLWWFLLHRSLGDVVIRASISSDNSALSDPVEVTTVTDGDSDLEPQEYDAPELGVSETDETHLYGGRRPLCFWNTVGNGQPEEANNEWNNTVNHPEQYYDLYEFKGSDASDPGILLLENNNSIPYRCYFGTVNSEFWECDQVRILFPGVSTSCQMYGLTFTINPVPLPTPYSIPDSIPPPEYSFSVDISSYTGDQLATVKQIVRNIVAYQAWDYKVAYAAFVDISYANEDRSNSNLKVVNMLVVLMYTWAAIIFLMTAQWLTWAFPPSKLFQQWCSIKFCARYTVWCGPDWMDYVYWFTLLVAVFGTFRFDDSILVQGMCLFMATFFCFLISIWYCSRWRREMCCKYLCCGHCCKFCPDQCCDECCPDLTSNDENLSVVEMVSREANKRGPIHQPGWSRSSTKNLNDDDVELCTCVLSRSKKDSYPDQFFNCFPRGCAESFEECFSHGCPPLHSRPQEFSVCQRRCMGVFSCGVIGLFAFTSIYYLAVWKIDYYQVMSRQTRLMETEYTPAAIAKFQALLYSRDEEFKTRDYDNSIFKSTTAFCGSHYDTKLSNSEKKSDIRDSYIDTYDIPMDIYNRTGYWQFVSVNDWFSRHLLEHIVPNLRSVRPITAADDDDVVVSPADSRVVVFDTVSPDEDIWIKGSDFRATTLIDSDNDVYLDCLGCKSTFQGITQMGIFRLAPQDYHRYHMPVSGRFEIGFEVGDSLHSVSADAMTSANEAIYNKRFVMWIKPDNWGEKYMAYVIIGAVCVGSINLTPPEDTTGCTYPNINTISVSQDPTFLNGCHFNKGDAVGTFMFGGSTIAMLTPQDTITWDPDLLYSSYFPVEQQLTMGSQIARRV